MDDRDNLSTGLSDVDSALVNV